MVTKYTAKGNPYKEPPYTEKEEMEILRSINGQARVFSSLRHPRKPKKSREG